MWRNNLIRLAAQALLAMAIGHSANNAQAGPPPVVATIPPVHSLIAGIMQGIGTPHLLLKGAVSPHTHALRPSDARRLHSARVIFWIGPGLEGFLTRSLAALAGTARVVTLTKVSGMSLLPARGRHSDGHTDGPAPDPHLWLDPDNARRIVAVAAHALADEDPANAASYRRNGARVAARLEDLTQRMKHRFAGRPAVPFIVFHDSFQYMERALGLHAAGFVTIAPDRPPGARHLGDIRAVLADAGAACVFTEPQFEPRLISSLVEGTQARVGVLDALGSGLQAGHGLYFKIMENNLSTLADCLIGRRDG
ncbi:MAG: zinc ABC transporter substrate-binding protein [Rhodospirillales bacterium]|nr:zinc ABC transporter substrate-binding protein [Rhodospirillales bacterium]